MKIAFRKKEEMREGEAKGFLHGLPILTHKHDLTILLSAFNFTQLTVGLGSWCVLNLLKQFFRCSALYLIIVLMFLKINFN